MLDLTAREIRRFSDVDGRDAAAAAALLVAVPLFVWLDPPRLWAIGWGLAAALLLGIQLQRELETSRNSLLAGAALGTLAHAILHAGLGSAAAVGLTTLAIVASGTLLGRRALAACATVTLAALLLDADAWNVRVARVVLTAAAIILGALAASRDSVQLPAFQRALRRESRLLTNGSASMAPDRVEADAARSIEASVRATVDLARRVSSSTELFVVTLDGDDRPAPVRAASVADFASALAPRDGLVGELRRAPRFTHAAGTGPTSIPWRKANDATRHIAGVGIHDEGLLVGAIFADRLASEPAFGERDLDALECASRLIAGSLRAERMLLRALRDGAEYSVFLDAAGRLGEALTLEDVCRCLLELVRRFGSVETLALTVRDAVTGEHTIAFAEGPHADRLRDVRFPPDDGLVSLASARGHALPYSGRASAGSPPLFDGDAGSFTDAALLVLPIIVGHDVLGTVVLASRELEAYTGREREPMERVARYASPAIANALAFHKALHQATVDGMTGLLNHRTFRERAGLAIDRAERSGRPCAVIMLDIDHFKRVNDTWGHAMGDTVLIAVAEQLRAQLRKTDLGGRYGGEEFAILLEDTPIESAAALADRIREAVKAMVFETPTGPHRVTLSLGVAVWPTHGERIDTLVETADEALYRAKKGGRDRVVRADHAAG